MSKYHVSHSPQSVVRVIKTMTLEEIEAQYGVQIDEDGSVWDPLDMREFHTVTEWALYMDEVNEQEMEASMYKGHSRYAFDDEY